MAGSSKAKQAKHDLALALAGQMPDMGGKLPRGKDCIQAASIAVPQMRAAYQQHVKQKRHVRYTDEIGAELCRRVVEGRLIDEVCTDSDMPDRTTVYRWLRDPQKASFATAYAYAREGFSDFAAGFALRTAEALASETDPSAGRVASGRLLVDTLKWYASNLNPKQYADQRRQHVELTGAGGGPVQVAAVTIDAASLTPDQREVLRLALRAGRDAATVIDAATGEAIDEDSDD
jgi:hypothetical protein